MSIHEITQVITPILRKHNVTFAGIFGSVARGEATEHSDIDLLIRFGERKSLLDHARLDRELSEVLQRPVDTVTERSLHPYIKDSVFNDLKVLYGKR